MEQENLEAVLAEIDSLAEDVGPLIAPKDWSKISDYQRERAKTAKRRLKDIFRHSTWISARYEASKYLADIPDVYAIPRMLEDNRIFTLRIARAFRLLFDNVEDEENLSRLKKDFGTFYSLIQFKYLRQWVACEVMGYSRLRYIAMEHPLEARLAGIAAAVGTVSGIVYGLMEYFGGS
ncbi:hypothetical protein KY361_02505 [Candidatus Woesearchaeota archaeon]|nr:hypothetical protein [Candidatus Woesearchaeota archaeon]